MLPENGATVSRGGGLNSIWSISVKNLAFLRVSSKKALNSNFLTQLIEKGKKMRIGKWGRKNRVIPGFLPLDLDSIWCILVKNGF